MSTTPVRVVLAEDNLLVQRGLAQIVAEAPDLDLVGVAAAFDELMEQVRTLCPEVVVTDIRMPPTHSDEGVRAAAVLRDTHPEVGVVVLSQFLGSDYAIALLDAGSARRGYLLKDKVAAPEQLANAIRAVARGGSFIDADVVDALVARRAAHPSGVDRLSDREREVMALVARGLANGAVADHLGVSVRSVEKHISSIFTKLGLFDDPASHRRVSAALRYLAHVEAATPQESR